MQPKYALISGLILVTLSLFLPVIYSPWLRQDGLVVRLPDTEFDLVLSTFHSVENILKISPSIHRVIKYIIPLAGFCLVIALWRTRVNIKVKGSIIIFLGVIGAIATVHEANFLFRLGKALEPLISSTAPFYCSSYPENCLASYGSGFLVALIGFCAITIGGITMMIGDTQKEKGQNQ